MTNALNFIAWAGTYGVGLRGASDVVTATATVGYRFVDFVWKGIGEGDWANKRNDFFAHVKTSAGQFKEGVQFVALALVIRQVVARIFSPVAPDSVTNALSILGWRHVRSPLVDSLYNMLPNAITSRVTLY